MTLLQSTDLLISLGSDLGMVAEYIRCLCIITVPICREQTAVAALLDFASKQAQSYALHF